MADELRAEILEQELAPGAPLLSEADLMLKFDYGRATVREALRLLEVEGFVEIQRGQNGGVRVRHPDAALIGRSVATMLVLTQAPLSDLVTFRELNEPSAAAMAAKNATADQRRLLIELADQPGREGDFHALIAESSQNLLVSLLLAGVGHVSGWHSELEHLEPHHLEQTRRAHKRISLAIEQGDSDAAYKAMVSHVRGYRQVMNDLGRLDAPVLPRRQWIQHLRRTFRSI